MWNKMEQAVPPSMEAVDAYVGNPLWQDLCRHVEERYQVTPRFEYSRCCVPGWNVKYRKSGRGLCTLYPMEGYFIALVVIGERERAQAELALPLFTDYLQQLYHRTKPGMGQRWLMIEVRDRAVLDDVMACVAIRWSGKKA